MGRDVGRDEGRDQAAWRELVARLELMSPIDPADAPWPDRENLPAKPSSGATRPFNADDFFAPSQSDPGDDADQAGSPRPADEVAEVTDGETTAPTAAIEQADAPVMQAEPDAPADSAAQDLIETDDSPGRGPGSSTGPDTKRDSRPDRRPPVSRSRIIRPASYPRFGRAIPRQIGPSAHADDQNAASRSRGGPFDPLEDLSGSSRPRDFSLADDSVFDFGDGDRYIPPALPPMGGVDPVIAGAWVALFGGPAYLLISMVTDWQSPRWTALVAVIAFVAGFIVLVFRLGDGPSKRDGPDQGAVV